MESELKKSTLGSVQQTTVYRPRRWLRKTITFTLTLALGTGLNATGANATSALAKYLWHSSHPGALCHGVFEIWNERHNKEGVASYEIGLALDFFKRMSPLHKRDSSKTDQEMFDDGSNAGKSFMAEASFGGMVEAFIECTDIYIRNLGPIDRPLDPERRVYDPPVRDWKEDPDFETYRSVSVNLDDVSDGICTKYDYDENGNKYCRDYYYIESLVESHKHMKSLCKQINYFWFGYYNSCQEVGYIRVGNRHFYEELKICVFDSEREKTYLFDIAFNRKRDSGDGIEVSDPMDSYHEHRDFCRPRDSRVFRSDIKKYFYYNESDRLLRSEY